MLITRIDTAFYRFPAHRKIVDAIQEFTHMEVIAATVHTDEGSAGMGFGYTIGRGGRAVKVFLDEELVPLVLGEDPTGNTWTRRRVPLGEIATLPRRDKLFSRIRRRRGMPGQSNPQQHSNRLETTDKFPAGQSA